jgi:hypothetical protein
MMDSWVEEELKDADLGDARRNRRLVKIVSDLVAQPNSSVPQASGNWAATQGAYDFWGNPRVKADEIIQAHQCSTIARVEQQQVVLAVQDTTELNFTHHPGKKGLGYLDSSKSRGLKVHSTFCVSSSGVPLGLLNQQVWVREDQDLGKKHLRHKKNIQEKESQRWITALAQTQTAIPLATTVVTVADREADIYDLLITPRSVNSHLLIRASHNRAVSSLEPSGAKGQRLLDRLHHCPVRGQITIEIHPVADKEPRQAILTIRATSVEIQPPLGHPNYQQLSPMTIQVIQAREENPPTGVKPVSWLLLTTLPINGFTDALQCLRWYSYRWLIERYHYVLKSGCRLEQLQLETADRIERALATYSIVAWRLLWLTYEARYHPSALADTVFQSYEWKALYCYVHSTPIPPETPPTLNQCVRWIARLGGFLGRKGDGEPGVKTIWLGLRRLDDIAGTWKLLYGIT